MVRLSAAWPLPTRTTILTLHPARLHAKGTISRAYCRPPQLWALKISNSSCYFLQGQRGKFSFPPVTTKATLLLGTLGRCWIFQPCEQFCKGSHVPGALCTQEQAATQQNNGLWVSFTHSC